MQKDHLKQTRKILQNLLHKKNYPPEEINSLLTHIYELSNTVDIYTRPDTTMSPKQRKRFTQICLHLKADQPIAYIVGYQNFAGLRFAVTSKVLIPRYETEGLVITNHLWNLLQTKHVTLIDIGTGSGNIIISNYYHLVKKIVYQHQPKLLKNITFWGIDIDQNALTVAHKNMMTLLAKFKHSNFPPIKMLHGYLLKPLINKLKDNNSKHQIVILANLPYIPHRVYMKLPRSVKYEPRIALSPPKDIDLVAELINSAPAGTELFLENYNAALPTKFEIKNIFV